MKTIITLIIATFSLSIWAADTPAPKPYPLTTCIVSGDKLGEMGKPVVIIKDGQEVKLCCKSCIKDFNKEPEKFLKEIAEKSKAKK
ncbi:hypothetical protein BH11VER1_BH11VER1_01010 [soil metagenome]